MASISASKRQVSDSLNPKVHSSSKRADQGPSKKPVDNIDGSKLKLEVRLLPPTLTEMEFTEQLSKYFKQMNLISSSYYIQGHLPNKPYENPTFSRAYILFQDNSSVDAFLSDLHEKPFSESTTSDSLIPVIEKSITNQMPEIKAAKKSLDMTLINKNPFFKLFNEFIGGTSKSFDVLEEQNRLKKSKKTKQKSVKVSKSENQKTFKSEASKNEIEAKKSKVSRNKNKTIKVNHGDSVNDVEANAGSASKKKRKTKNSKNSERPNSLEQNGKADASIISDEKGSVKTRKQKSTSKKTKGENDAARVGLVKPLVKKSRVKKNDTTLDLESQKSKNDVNNKDKTSKGPKKKSSQKTNELQS